MKNSHQHFAPTYYLKPLFLLVFVIIATWLPAQTWVGVTNEWTVASNWNPAQVPSATSVVTIPQTTIKPNVKDGQSVVVKSIKIEADGGLFIREGGTLTLSNAVGTALENKGNLHIYGTLYINGATDITNYGIDNYDLTKIYSTGQIHIQNTYVGIANGWNANFDHKGDLFINQNGGTSQYGILNNGKFNTQGSLIKIDRTTLVAIKNEGFNAEFFHWGTAELGSIASIGDYGIGNWSSAKFTHFGGTLLINRTGKKAIDNKGKEFVNKGTLRIGNYASVGEYGLYSEIASFENGYTGELEIDRCTEASVYIEHSQLENSGLIKVGTLSNSGGKYGVMCIGGTLKNNSIGQIILENATEVSLFNMKTGVPGVVRNEGLVSLNSQSHGTLGAIQNRSYMENYYSGQILVGATQNVGLLNEVDAEFHNNGTLNFSPAVLNGSFNCLFNQGLFETGLTSSSLLYGKIFNNGALLNKGTLGLYSAQNSTNIGSGFVNDGAIMMNPAVTLNNLVNHDLVIKPFSGDCFSVSPALTIGTANSFQVAATWHQNIGMNQPAGTYNAVTNTFNQQVVAPYLYFQVTNTEFNQTMNVFTASSLQDNIPPSVTCKNITIPLNASGQASITANDIMTSMSDNCGPGAVFVQSVSATNFQCNQLGTNTVTLIVRDAGGNTAGCQALVQVKDVTAPTITCNNTPVFLNAAGTATVTPAQLLQAMGDNCSATLQPLANNTFGCAQTGPQSLVLTAKDASGNTATCTAIVTVVDAVAPTVQCQSATLPLDAFGQATLSINQVLLSASDNCQVQSTSLSKTAFTCAEAGLNAVEVKAVDPSGNSTWCNATVTVIDALAPVVACKPATLFLDAWGQATLSVNQVLQSATDNCQIQSTSLSKTHFNCADAGLHTVEVKAFDASGNMGKCNASVTVKDVQIPVAKCKDVTINLGANGTVTTFGGTLNNGSSDNCGFALATVPASLSCANVGINTVTLRVNDASGNTATCTSKVTVKDVTPPSALCKNPTIFLDDEGKATLTIAAVNNGSSDACGISTLVLSKTQFNCSELQGSAWPVTMSVRDINNNTATCTAYVTIKDALAPEAICQNTSVALESNGKVTVYGQELAGESIDNCSVWSYSPIAKVYTAANLGVNNLTITVKDWSGNAATCVSQVTVMPYGGNMGLPVEDRERTMDEQADMPVSLYPNPAFDWVNVAFQLDENQVFSLKVSDFSGRLLLEQTGQGTAGENLLSLDLKALPAGMYLLVFESAGRQVIKKLVKDRK